jgi:hypothetical protein
VSYVRFGENGSDVYVIQDARGGWTTYWTDSIDNDPTPGACADRLERLRTEGHTVPQYAIDDLRSEQQEIDAAAARVAEERGQQ